MNKSAKLSVCMCLVIAACVPEGAGDEPATETTEQDVVGPNGHSWKQSFGGSFIATPFNYVSEQGLPQGACSPGFVHPTTPDVSWTSQGGGFCQFDHWNAGPGDCRAAIRGSTGGGFFGLDCFTSVREVSASDPPVVSSFSFVGSNTNSAQMNTTDRAIVLGSGQTLTIGTCGVQGASFSGDTYIRLFNQSGQRASESDDNPAACGAGTRGSQLTFTAPSPGQTYTIRAGCFSNLNCSGTVAWTIQ